MVSLSVPLFSNSQSFADSDREFALNVLRSPLVQRLKAAGLIDSINADIVEWIKEWRQVGGSFASVFSKRSGLSMQTLRFFSQKDPLPSAGGRLGDYLVAAGLVPRVTVLETLAEINNSNRKQLLGHALVKRKYISKQTANYFAETYTNPSPESLDPEHALLSKGLARPQQRKAPYSLDEFFLLAADAAIHARSIAPKLREDAADMLAAYPKHRIVKYWCARLGVTTSKVF
ncbi:MAG: hypothetical protein AB4040_11805 [Synechococcus sp.]